jgi:hypothetical protein
LCCSKTQLSQFREALSVWPVSRNIDRYDTTFDHDGLIANAGLIVTATLMVRLGLESLANRWVRTGSANAGRKICTLVAAMLAGGTHIDHVDVVRAGSTQAVLPFKVMAPSTIGTFLRSFTFGFVRQLDAVASRLLARAWELGAGPGDRDLVIDLDSTVCEVHGRAKQGAGYGYTKQLGYHPLLATRAGTGEILFSRMRKGSAGSSRGVNRFVDELAGLVRRAGARGPITVRADSGFWSWELLRTLDRHRMHWSITVTSNRKIQAAIASIPDNAWIDIDYTIGGHAQVAETTYVGGGRRIKDRRTVRLVVRRTRLTDPAQLRLWPDWRHHAFITNRDDLTGVEADQFHREHAVVELAIRDLKAGGAEHIPSGRYPANAAWLGCAVIAHNVARWSCLLSDQPTITNTTFRTRITAVPAVAVNRSGQPTLRLPTRWPWATNFTSVLTALRALPGPAG